MEGMRVGGPSIDRCGSAWKVALDWGERMENDLHWPPMAGS